MKLYIVYGGNLYPQQGMSQVRVYNQLIGLSSVHQIVFSDVISNWESLRQAKHQLGKLNIDYRPVITHKIRKNKIQRAFGLLLRKIEYNLKTVTKEELSLASKNIFHDIVNIADETKADAVIIHYWYLGSIFEKLNPETLRMIDTHYVVEENIELLDSYSLSRYKRWKLRKELEYSLDMQRKYFLDSDLVIVNSQKQKKLIHAWNPRIPVSVVMNGQDLNPYLSFKAPKKAEATVGFYGSLSNQFNRKALQRILYHIYPAIKLQLPDVKLLIIGANPPMDIIGKVNDDSIQVTGFVEDIRPHLSKCKVILLPLDTGSGFRGRAVEIMALGIPLVGTGNSLQSVGLVNGEQGFVVDTDAEMAQKTVELLTDADLWSRISQNSKKFAEGKFSIAATFGALSKEITAISKWQRKLVT